MAADRIVVLGDLVRSRSAGERPALARRIQGVLRDIGREFGAEFIALPVLTKGLDEFSAVLRRPNRLFDLFIAINLPLWPLRFRLSAAAGAIDVGLRSGDAAQMDGPAFHLAADGIRRADAERRPLVLNLPAADEIDMQLVQSLAEAHAAILSSWSPASARVVAAVRRYGTQVRTAQKLKVSQQFVSKELDRAQHRTLLRIEEAAGRWFGHPHRSHHGREPSLRRA